MPENLTAAVDLGSNSFHLLLARRRDDGWIALERVKEKVQLGRGLTGTNLSADALRRGLECVERFAQRLHAVPQDQLTIVGTCALREAKNRDEFLHQAERILGAPVRVLAGAEEAALIFLGVSHVLTADSRQRLVVDIGGGSTEFAFGRSFAAERVASINLGCVSLTDRCFQAGKPLPAAFNDARREAMKLLEGVTPQLGGAGWDEVIGTSGTIESIQDVLEANGWCRQQQITPDGLARIEQAIVDRRWVSGFGIPGLAPERVDIFPAGVAALAAIMSALDISAVRCCDASLLDGLLYDMSGRRSVENVQERTVMNWRDRLDASPAQVARVRRTVETLWRHVSVPWQLEDDDARSLLGWAAELHEIGFEVSARQPQRHGAYLIQNGDMPGFSAEQQRAVALLVRCHRGGMPAFAFAAYDSETGRRMQKMAVLLRIAVILERSRCDEHSPRVAAHVEGERLLLELPADWLAGHALSRAELDSERNRLERLGIDLQVIAT